LRIAHLFYFGPHPPDVLRCHNGCIDVSGPVPERIFRGIVQPEDSPVCVADEARDIDPLIVS
jgi:hypothetical protein